MILLRSTILCLVQALLCSAGGQASAAEEKPAFQERLEKWGPRPRSRELQWTPVDADSVDTAGLSQRARRTLGMTSIPWQHAQTEHFVVHYDDERLGRRTAAMAEYFYDYISADLQGPEDRMPGRSHIFIFRRQTDWEKFIEEVQPGVPPWTYSFVSGRVMYVRKGKDPRHSSETLAHEMTHLVVNRFFRKRPPLWLNEGLAEWYGEFAYSAFNGVRPGQRSKFKRLSAAMPLEYLLFAERYPPEGVHAFYEQSKYLVGWIRLENEEESMQAFMQDMLQGRPVIDSFETRLGVSSLAELETQFRRFARY